MEQNNPSSKKCNEEIADSDTKEEITQMDLDEFLCIQKCVFCYCIMTTKECSKILQCLHPSCDSCFQKQVKFAELEVDGNLKIITCPVCDYPSFLNKIIDNKFLEEICALQKFKDSSVCRNCKTPANDWCITCTAFMCKNCISAHKLLHITSDHVIKPVLEICDARECKPSNIVSYPCSQHPKEELSLFCETCYEVTCRDCQLLHHREHTHKFVTEMAAQCRTDMKNRIHKLRYRNALIQEAIAQVDLKNKRSLDKKEEFLAIIRNYAADLVTHINKMKENVESQVKTEFERKKVANDECMTALKKFHTDASYLTDFVAQALELSSDSFIAFSRNLVTEKLKKTETVPKIPHPSYLSDMKISQTEHLEKLKKVLSTNFLKFEKDSQGLNQQSNDTRTQPIPMQQNPQQEVCNQSQPFPQQQHQTAPVSQQPFQTLPQQHGFQQVPQQQVQQQNPDNLYMRHMLQTRQSEMQKNMSGTANILHQQLLQPLDRIQQNIHGQIQQQQQEQLNQQQQAKQKQQAKQQQGKQQQQAQQQQMKQQHHLLRDQHRWPPPNQQPVLNTTIQGIQQPNNTSSTVAPTTSMMGPQPRFAQATSVQPIKDFYINLTDTTLYENFIPQDIFPPKFPQGLKDKVIKRIMELQNSGKTVQLHQLSQALWKKMRDILQNQKEKEMATITWHTPQGTSSENTQAPTQSNKDGPYKNTFAGTNQATLSGGIQQSSASSSNPPVSWHTPQGTNPENTQVPTQPTKDVPHKNRYTGQNQATSSGDTEQSSASSLNPMVSAHPKESLTNILESLSIIDETCARITSPGDDRISSSNIPVTPEALTPNSDILIQHGLPILDLEGEF